MAKIGEREGEQSPQSAFPLPSTELKSHTTALLPSVSMLPLPTPAAVDGQGAASPLGFPTNTACSGVATHSLRHLSSLLLLMVCCAPSQIQLSSAMLLLQTPCNPCSQNEFLTNSGQSKLLAPLRVSWTWPRMPTYRVMGSQIHGCQLQGSTGGAQLAQSVPSPISGTSHSTAPLIPSVLLSACPLAPITYRAYW